MNLIPQEGEDLVETVFDRKHWWFMILTFAVLIIVGGGVAGWIFYKWVQTKNFYNEMFKQAALLDDNITTWLKRNPNGMLAELLEFINENVKSREKIIRQIELHVM